MAFDPKNILKSIKDGIRFNRRNNRSVDEEERIRESPGDVTVGGQHKKVNGINRQLIGGVILFGVLVYACSTFIFSSEEQQVAQQPVEYDVSATKKTSGMGETENQPNLTYQDLRNRNQPNRAEASSLMSGQMTPAEQDALQMQQQANRQVYAPVSSQSYGAATQDVVASLEAQRKVRLEQELEERYQSAIEFAIASKGQQVAGSSVAIAQTGTMTAGLSTQTQNPITTLQTASVSYQSMSPNILQVGTILPAMLFSGINTDTPGQVIAEVSRDVYDSATGVNLLIPSGTQLIGSMQNGSKETGRIGVTFQTMIFPNGTAYDVGNALVAVDGGYNGLQGKVHRHTSKVLAAGALTSAIAALGSYASGDTSGNNSYTGGQLMMQGAQANLLNNVSNLFNQATNIQPTITIEPGYTFQVYVMQSISF